MSRALKATTVGRDFDLCAMRVVVIQFSGTVQLCWLTDGWPSGSREVMANVFCDTATPAQLRALADHLDTLPLSDPVEVLP